MINRLPPILQISISRVMYDRERGTGYKIEHHLQLEDVLYLDRYVEHRPYGDMIELRKVSWELKRRLQKLKARKTHLSETPIGVDMPSAMDATSDFIKTVNVDSDIDPQEEQTDKMIEEGTNVQGSTEELSSLSKSLHTVANNLRKELSDLETEIKEINVQLSELFASYRRIPYRLHAVFIHRGTAAGGHYWVYICDFSSSTGIASPYFSSKSGSKDDNGTWRCYNDSSVTPVTDPEQTIFSEDTVNNPGLHRATPNLLIYVREDKKEQIVDALHRHVAQEVLADHQVKQQQHQRENFNANSPCPPCTENSDNIGNSTVYAANQEPSIKTTRDSSERSDQQSRKHVENATTPADSPVLGR